jgi:hypothetical protein
MPVIEQPGITDDSGVVTPIGAVDLIGYTDSLIIPGELFPLQQITVTIVVNNIMGGASPTITFSLDQLNQNGEGWTSIWNSGAQSGPGTVGPTIVNPPAGGTAFDPPELRLSWSTTGQPTQVDFTPTISAA